MSSFRLVGNSPCMVYLACRLVEEGYAVEWWTSGYLSPLRPLRLRSESIDDLSALFRRHRMTADFLSKSPQLKAWASIRDGGPVVRLWSDMDEGFEDRWVEGAELFRHLRSVAGTLDMTIKEFSGSFPNPLNDLPETTALIIDVMMPEARLWPPPERAKVSTSALTQTVMNYWLPQLPTGTGDGARGFLFGDWKGCRLVLEPHPFRGFVLTLLSGVSYNIDRAFKDILDPKVAGLSELRALFVLNGQKFSQEKLQIKPGLAFDILPMAFHLGHSVGSFSPALNQQDDWGFRECERLLNHIEDNRVSTATRLLPIIHRWNENTRARFESEFRRTQIWERLFFAKGWGRWIVRASRYLPKTLRERIQVPA